MTRSASKRNKSSSTKSATANRLIKSTLHEGLLSELRARIKEGLLLPGQRILEVQLCEEFKVSRTPMREALKVLAAEGWIQWRANFGATVSDVNPEEIDAIFEAMAGLEHQIGILAATRASDADIVEIEGMHAKLERFFRAGNRVAYFKINQLIHNRIAEAAANPIIADLYHSLSAKVYRARSLANAEHQQWERSFGEHDAFMKALHSRDGIAFGDALKNHSEMTRIVVVGELRRAVLTKMRKKAAWTG